MSKEFYVKTANQLKQFEISFADTIKDNEYEMTLNLNTPQDFDYFKRHLTAYRNGYSKINFTMVSDGKNYLITLAGNIASALQIMKDQKLLSSDSFEKIYADNELNQLLEKSKAFKLSNQEPLDENLFSAYKNTKQSSTSSSTSNQNEESIVQAEKQLKALYLSMPADKLINELSSFINQVLKEKGLQQVEVKFVDQMPPNLPTLKL